MIEDEPLYIDSLIADGSAPVAYVCGKRSGIRFELLVPLMMRLGDAIRNTKQDYYG